MKDRVKKEEPADKKGKGKFNRYGLIDEDIKKMKRKKGIFIEFFFNHTTVESRMTRLKIRESDCWNLSKAQKVAPELRAHAK